MQIEFLRQKFNKNKISQEKLVFRLDFLLYNKEQVFFVGFNDCPFTLDNNKVTRTALPEN